MEYQQVNMKMDVDNLHKLQELLKLLCIIGNQFINLLFDQFESLHYLYQSLTLDSSHFSHKSHE